jgi:hypothetical protein
MVLVVVVLQGVAKQRQQQHTGCGNAALTSHAYSLL